ncbi:MULTISPECIES: hypothetical protein [Streptomyces]|uniref:hypothetical protein n=1 Tax=Streptomyces TaxID=1883 RepID=UPI00224D7139|nr:MULTISPECIES: hypothetical protein [Streptomyces]MCX5252543.1 hypothetical protein [Streptomyces sp. NBC_00201]
MSEEQADTGPVEAWLAEVAARSRQPLPVVRKVLAQHRVRPQMAPPRPHRLLVTSVAFDGVRPAADSVAGERNGEPFTFSWDLGPGLWCLASLGKNEAGKSSVLEIVLWCLRGRSGLQRDVRHWLRAVQVGFELDGEPLLVDIAVRAGSPQGHVLSTRSGTVLVDFDGLADFEEAMDAFMLERLGLETLRTAQAAPGGPSEPPITGELSWPSYASALHISRSGLGILLGNDARHGLPTRLLELFLGAPWASTKVEAAVALKIVRAQLSAARSRAVGDAEARKAQLEELSRRLTQAQDRLAALDGADGTTADVQQLYAELAASTEAAVTAQDVVLAVRSTHNELEAQRRDLAAAVHTAEEASLARAFFHTLMPTVCPRCDTAVDKARWEREREGHCSLCASDLHEAHSGADEDESGAQTADLRQMLVEVQQAVDGAAAELTQAQQQASQADAGREGAAGRLQEALGSPGLRERREMELVVARLEGAVEERSGRFADLDASVDLEPLEQAGAVLAAAEKLAMDRRTQVLKKVLGDVEKDIVVMGRALGLEMLKEVKLGGNASLTVWKGGQKHSYGSLTEGEQLRLKIVTTIALLRHGYRSGVGRYPGLLFIDSPGAEEVDAGDLQHMLRDLVTLTEMVPELQVIVATARGAEVKEIVSADNMRLAAEGQRLW